MIECIFTIDYEIYGNGEGSLRKHVYDPTRQLMDLFQKWNARFVSFVEVAEFDRIKECQTDEGIGDVENQIRDMHRLGFEVALHLHPQWYNGRYENGRWELNYDEYNLCTLPQEQIEAIVERAIAYLRQVLGEPDFVPVSFRAGNWLLQPTETAAAVLARKGIKIDSSVFKGGLQRRFGLDYRPALRNGYFWRFGADANRPDSEGALLEIPTYSVMVPSWKMLTSKRVQLQRHSPTTAQSPRQKLNRLLDVLRPWYPLKFDFCRMTLKELIAIMDRAIDADRRNPESYKPLVAIGHSKDLVDFKTIEAFLSYLKDRNIAVVNLQDTLRKCHAGIAAQRA